MLGIDFTAFVEGIVDRSEVGAAGVYELSNPVMKKSD